ncbi:rCG57673 [Rattus norvegicus]|uniref:RCG57673 n=1 Tax=Rattus norvegicus TaxID=10116 RepID=A6JI90_RAT|nr:rCG57673 [Rattus norvegicus]
MSGSQTSYHKAYRAPGHPWDQWIHQEHWR